MNKSEDPASFWLRLLVQRTLHLPQLLRRRPPASWQSMERLEERAMLAGLSYFAPAVGFGAAATGGEGGPVLVADTAAEFRSYAQRSGARIIKVQGSLDVGSVSIWGNATIVGDGNDALRGELNLVGAKNVIIQNLSISNPAGSGGGDAISMRGASTVWIDHVNVFDAPDGLIDITKASDFVTVSWSKIYYTAADKPDHNFAMLIGGDDADTGDRGKLHVTLHHNWWGERIRERMPRARFGDVHVFNNYFNAPGSYYCIRAAIESEVLVQNNHFQNAANPHIVYVTTGTKGRIEATGNVYVNTWGSHHGGSDVFNPSYAYTLDAGSAVKGIVTAGAGVKTLPATKFFVVDDGSAGRTYEYAADGKVVQSYGLPAANANPRDVAGRAAGDRVWVVNNAPTGADAVCVYDSAGALLGSWTPKTTGGADLGTPEGIATDGTNIWIVDDASNTVYRYSGAATRTSGAVKASSSFALAANGANVNASPRGITTDGKSLWVVDNAASDRVFKYTLAGWLGGAWTIDARNSNPTGITLNPTSVNHLWVVDSGTDSVYSYNSATARTSGNQSAAGVFKLVAGNSNPQGIADPPPAEAAPAGAALPAADARVFLPVPLPVLPARPLRSDALWAGVFEDPEVAD